MPSFGRIGRHSNHSQHNLIEQQANAPPSLLTSSSSGVGPGTGPGGVPVSASASASSSTNTPTSALSAALSSSESGQVDTRAQQQTQNKQILQTQQQQQQLLEDYSRSISQHQHQQQQPPPGLPPAYTAINSTPLASNHTHSHGHNPTTTSVPNSAGAAAAYGSSRQPQQQQKQKGSHQDFADSVSRSQSTRYPQVSPAQTQQHFLPGSSSVDNLPGTISSPLIPQVQPGHPIGPHHQQHPSQTAPIEAKQSTRKLIRKILQGGSASRNSCATVASPPDPHHQQHHSSYDSSPGLARRPSKRVSNSFPSSMRSSASLEQQQIPDWQQQQPSTQASPLQGVGETEEAYSHEKPAPNPELRLQNTNTHPQGPTPRPHPHQNSIRQVPADAETSPYSPEDLNGYQQQQTQTQAQAQLQARSGQQQLQQRYGQVEVVVDPAQPLEPYQQYAQSQAQGQSQYQQGNPPRIYTTHLASQQSNPETISQLSYESPVTDSDQRSAHVQSTQASPAGNYSHQQLAVAPQNQQPVSPSSSLAQPAPMAPPPGGPQSRRSGDNDKMRGNNIEPPPGPPPNYRTSQAVNTMGALPPTPGQAQPNRDFRASNVPERQAQQQQFEGGTETGRQSPQPSTGGERDADPEKQFKDLCMLSPA